MQLIKGNPVSLEKGITRKPNERKNNEEVVHARSDVLMRQRRGNIHKRDRRK